MIDVLICWPRHLDFPLFRYFLKKYRKYFNEIFIALTTGLSDRDVSQFLISNMRTARCKTLPYPQAKQDWRDVAVNELLLMSQSKYVLFLEQDFLFLEKVIEFVSLYDKPFLGFREGDRVHPSFALVERAYIEKTSKDFSAHPPEHDHFGRFFRELKNVLDFRYIDEFGFNYKYHFYHMNGLSQNYMCFREGIPFYKKDEFLTYNHLVQKLEIEQHPDFLALSKTIEDKYGKGDIKFITHFFPNNKGVDTQNGK